MKANYLYDDFSSITGLWDPTDAATGVVTGGGMRIKPTTGYDAVYSVDQYDLTSSHLGFKLVENAELGAGSNSIALRAEVDGSNSFEFEIGGGRLLADGAVVTMREKVAGAATTTTLTYDPDTHVWFRLREDSGTIYWETSEDGSVWTAQRSKSSTLTLTTVTCGIWGGYWDSEAGTTYATIDDFNLWDGPPVNDKMDTLTDGFGSLDTETWSTTGSAAVSGGALVVDAGAGAGEAATRNPYDLEDSYVAVQVAADFAASDQFHCELMVTPEVGAWQDYLSIMMDREYLYFDERVGGGTVSSEPVPFNPLKHKWFRIRSSGSTVTWETSRDGEAWTIRRTKTTALPLDALYVTLSGGEWEESGEDGTATFDNLNVIGGTGTDQPDEIAAELLTDDFTSDATLETKWYTEGGWEIDGGRLKCVPTNEYRYIQSAESWDLRDSHFAFELRQNASRGITEDLSSVTSDFQVDIGGGDYFFFRLEGGIGSAPCVIRSHVDDTDTDTSFIYNANRDKWFRIRHADDTLYWETSTNSVAWTIRRSEDVTGLGFGAVTFKLVTGFWNEDDDDVGEIHVDNVNLPNVALIPQIGWTSSSPLPWGGYDGGTVVARNYFEEADWLWNPIPDNPVLDPDSENIGLWLHHPEADPTPQHGVNLIRYANAMIHPHMITEETPRYTVYWLGAVLHPEWWDGDDNPFAGWDNMIPIPYGTQIPPGSDAHLVVADPVTQKVFSFWQAFYVPETDSWVCVHGGVADLHGDGRDYIGGSTATNISRYAGVPRISELLAGEIPHALFVVSNSCAPGNNVTGFRYPATKSDGTNYASSPYPVEQGSRLQLDPSIDLAAVPGIGPGELAVGRCWQKYGAYVLDSGGNASPPTVTSGGAGELWQGQEYPVIPPTTDPWPDPDPADLVPTPPDYLAVGFPWDYYNLSHIPWEGNIRVLANWNGA